MTGLATADCVGATLAGPGLLATVAVGAGWGGWPP